MADDYKLQINTQVNGDLVNIRAQSGEELNDTLTGFAEHAGPIFKTLGDVKQAALANGVFSGPAVQSAPASAAPRAAANTAPGSVPECPTHGPMNDKRGVRNKTTGEPLRNRYFCKKFGCTDSKPQGEWIE